MSEIAPPSSVTGPFLQESIIRLIERVADAKNAVNTMAKKNLDPHVVQEFHAEAATNLSVALEILDSILYELKQEVV